MKRIIMFNIPTELEIVMLGVMNDILNPKDFEANIPTEEFANLSDDDEEDSE